MLSGTDVGGEAPAPDPNADPNAAAQPEPGAAPNQNMAIKSIQKLTGKLTQQMRSAGAALGSNDAKATINSVISAIDPSALTDEDRADIMSKLEGGGEESAEMPAEDPMSEYGTLQTNNDAEPTYDNSSARFRASGGQSIGEHQLNERLQSILDKAYANVQNKLTKI